MSKFNIKNGRKFSIQQIATLINVMKVPQNISIILMIDYLIFISYSIDQPQNVIKLSALLYEN